MDKSNWRVGLTAAVLTVGIGGPANAWAASNPCSTPAAKALHDVREQAMRREARELQAILDRTVGDKQPDAVEPGCIQGILEGGLGRSIKLPTLDGLMGSIADAATKAAIDAFCSRVNGVIDSVESVVGSNQTIDVTDVMMDQVGFDNAFGLDIPEVQYDVGVGGSYNTRSGGYQYSGTINSTRY